MLTVKNCKVKDNELIIVPDVMNCSLRRAINKLVLAGFTVEINGSGKIIDQIPKPGAEQLSKSKVILFCKNEF
jgi:beta-lactam-binding protein with PASTA domain